MDATLESLKKFDDLSHWDGTDDNVPIFVEHVAKNDKGEILYQIDEARLNAISDEINRLYAQDGCPIKMISGHTQDPTKVPQAQQPPLLGWGVGAHVGPWGPQGKKAVLVNRVFYNKGCKALAAQLPERSPEFYPGSNRIKAVALLKTDPRLNMGVMIYNEHHQPVRQAPEVKLYYGSDGAETFIRYGQGFLTSYGDTMPDPTQVPPSASELKKQEEEPKKGVPDDGDKDKFIQYMKSCYPEAHNTYGKHLHAQYGMAAPSGTNGAMPAQVPGMPPGTPSVTLPPQEKQAMGATQQPVQVGTVTQQGFFAAPTNGAPDDWEQRMAKIAYGKFENRIKALEQQTAVAECRAQVETLVNEGYFWKPGEAQKEVDRLMNMNQPQRLERANEVRINYQKAPVGDGAWIEQDLDHTPRGGTTAASQTQISPSDMNKIVKYCEQNKLDFNNQEHYHQAMRAVAQLKRG
jgi:hypothetical protein